MSAYDVPDWAWRLVIGLQRYEDQHPLLQRYATDASVVRARCPGYLLNLVPEGVRDTATVLDSFSTFPPPNGEDS